MKMWMMFIIMGVLCAAATESNKKLELNPYGFLKGDMYYANEKVMSWLSPSPTAVTRVKAKGASRMAFSAAHSRFGLKGSAEVGRAAVGGRLELDFFSINSNTNTNANPRMRLAYAWTKVLNGLEIRIGQQWDVFSPLNPTTNNTNANMWYVGNYGFRRTMFQLIFPLDFGAVVPCIQIAAGEGAKEAKDILGTDNASLVPMIQARLSADVVKKLTVGVSGAYAAFDRDRNLTTSGIGADIKADIHKMFAFKGEFCFGSNLNNANIFTIGGNGTEYRAVENIGFWANIISEPLDFLHIVGGVGREQIMDVSAEALESNFTAYGDLIIPVGKYFSLSGEYQYILTTVEGREGNGASVVDIAGKISF